MSTVAERIIEVVNAKGLNMSQFAREIGVTPAYISKLKNEPDRIPSDRTIVDICESYSVNRVWLETGVGEPFQPKNKQEELKAVFSDVLSGRHSEKNAFIEAMAQLPDDVFPVLVKSWIAAAEAMKEKLKEKE